MSSAAATAVAAPPKKRFPKIAVIALAVALLAGAGAGGAYYWMGRASSGEEADEPAHAARGEPPSFMALDAFTVNLADKDSDRFLQIGVTLELGDAKAADRIKVYTPAIRNAILMILAHKESKELLERTGKERLARDIRVETLRAMGVEVDDEEADEAPKKKRRKKAPENVPVRQVHFSSFIVN